MARSNVPKWGNWESDNSTPYTVYFDNARKNRGGKIINPNDPQENPDMFPNYIATPAAAAETKPKPRIVEPVVRGSARQTYENRGANDQPSHGQHYGGRGSNSGRPVRQSVGSDHSIEKSPIQSHYKGRASGKNSYDGTPGRSFESANATPVKPKMKQVSADRGGVVPPFGGWDEKNPQCADNYTLIFNKMREDRHVDAGNTPGTPGRTSYNPQKHHADDDKRKKSCFPWCM